MYIQFDRHLDPPIRAELFSAERLEQHAKSLAEAQPIGRPDRRRRSLRLRLFENSKRLIADFNRDWPDVTRTREMLVLAEEFVP